MSSARIIRYLLIMFGRSECGTMHVSHKGLDLCITCSGAAYTRLLHCILVIPADISGSSHWGTLCTADTGEGSGFADPAIKDALSAASAPTERLSADEVQVHASATEQLSDGS